MDLICSGDQQQREHTDYLAVTTTSGRAGHSMELKRLNPFIQNLPLLGLKLLEWGYAAECLLLPTNSLLQVLLRAPVSAAAALMTSVGTRVSDAAAPAAAPAEHRAKPGAARCAAVGTPSASLVHTPP